jgi:hypothetical protein
LWGYSPGGDLTVTVQEFARFLPKKSSTKIEAAEVIQQSDLVRVEIFAQSAEKKSAPVG